MKSSVLLIVLMAIFLAGCNRDKNKDTTGTTSAPATVVSPSDTAAPASAVSPSGSMGTTGDTYGPVSGTGGTSGMGTSGTGSSGR